jgi:hypothetical protein
MKTSIVLITLFVSFFGNAQFDFTQRQSELAVLLDSLRAAKNDADKMNWNEQFKQLMWSTVNEPTFFELQFTSLRSCGIIESPDGMVRIVNWNVEMDDQSQKYCAFVIQRDPKNNKHQAIELIDNSFMLPGKPEEVLDAENWYGALYYQIIPFERSGKTAYVLLGWDGGLQSSNTKLIDVLTFTGNSVKLGLSVFKMGDKTFKRVFFEHSEKAVMSLRYEDEYKRIIFDHLSPEAPNLTGFYEYYVPDMSYDAFILTGTKWVLKEDVIGVNKEEVAVKIHHMDPKTGEVIEEKPEESEWIDPTSSTPAGSKEVHIAALPDETEDPEKSDKNEKGRKKDKSQMTALEKYEKVKSPLSFCYSENYTIFA